MAKSRQLKKEQSALIEDFDYSDAIPYSDEDMMVGMISSLVAGSHHQMQTAIELTKLIISSHPDSSLDEDSILSIYQRASSVVSSSTPLNELWEKMQG